MRKLEARMEASGSLCVGLDPEVSKLPNALWSKTGTRNPVVAFCCDVIDRTAEYACAFKLNSAFFEARGHGGWSEMESVMSYLRERYPTHFTICDAKRADIGSTNRGYVSAVFDELGADAITLHPYLGAE